MTTEFMLPSGLDAVGPAFKLMARLQCETFALMSRRAKAYADLSKTLACCHSPEDVLTEQVRFWQIAQRTYMESFERALSAVPVGIETASKPDATVPAPRRDYLLVSERAPATAPATSPPSTAANVPSLEARDAPLRVRRSA